MAAWFFLKSARVEIINKQPAMMTLISLAITVAVDLSAWLVEVRPGSGLEWQLGLGVPLPAPAGLPPVVKT